MKAKDMKAHVPGWFRTKGEWMGSRPFYVRYLKHREGRSAHWTVSHTLKATGVGVIYNLETGELEECAMVEHLNMGQIDRELTRAEVLDYFETKTRNESIIAQQERRARAAVGKLSDFLKGAGVPHSLRTTTIDITMADVLKWADNNMEGGAV